MVDICRATKRRGKYPPLLTDNEVNNSFTKRVDSRHRIVPIFLTNEKKMARKIQSNAGGGGGGGIADAIPSLGSQSERA